MGSQGYAGSQRTMEFAKALSRNGFVVYLVSPYVKAHERLAENLFLMPVSKNPLKILRELKKLASTEKIDVILERLEGAHLVFNGYGAVIGHFLNIPAACEIHVPPTDIQTRITSFLWLRNSLRESKLAFLVSQKVTEMLFLHRKYLTGKIVTFPNGYDAMLADSLNTKDINLNLPPNKKVICYFGELSADKGIDLVLDLIKNDVNSAFYFVIGGWGPFASVVTSIVQERPDQVRFLGKVSKETIYNYLKASDLSLALYRRTQLGGTFFGQPLKVYESLAVGTNVLITSQMNLPTDIFSLCTLVKPKVSEIEQNMMIACLKKYDANWQNCLLATMPKYNWDSIASLIFVPKLKSLVKQSR